MNTGGDMLAVDPGINSPGAALFRSDVLVAAADIAVPSMMPDASHGRRALAAAYAIVGWAMSRSARIAVLAHEWPQIYAGSKSKADPNNLVAMAAVDGAVAAYFAFAMSREFELRTFLPAEWAGQLPKDTRKGKYWSSPRGLRIKSRLTDAEWAIASRLGHDAADAVGIGLHALGRLGVRRALSSGRAPGAL